ncbi:MAG: GNAT family N-acetyltransferase [Candidatus Melainabacteria bacterium]|nr:GNAT family N-acetyltransferase [Candidatus Melainabacteria bacterium]MBI3308170.1 GNAT family N-acetyltransferase [Candidatus Melainabacteria bacterium]
MFKIRTLRVGDISKIKGICENQEIINQINQNQCNLFLQPLIPYNFRTSPSIHLAIEESNLLGFVILKCASKVNNTWQIDHVFVPDELRNEGIGEELIRYVISIYGSYGIENFLAIADSTNSAAISLFQSCGFRKYAKVYYYEKEFDPSMESENYVPILDKSYTTRQITVNDLTKLEKLELSSIPPDLRHALGRSKSYFKEKKHSILLIDKSRNIIIGWFNINRLTNEHYFVDLLVSPGWTHLYEQLLNIVIYETISNKSYKIKLTVKVNDYFTELTQRLDEMGFLVTQAKDLLVRTVWQRVKEKKKKLAKFGLPHAAPT